MSEETEENQEDSEKATRSDRKAFSKAELADLVAKWESGAYTLAQLSEETGRTESVLSRKLKSLEAVKGARKDAIAERTKEIVEAEVLSASQQIAKDFRSINKESSEQVRSYQGLILREIGTANKNGTAISLHKQNIQTLKLAIEAVGTAQEIRIDSLGVDRNKIVDEKTITSLAVVQMSSEEVAEAQRSSSIQAGHIPEDENGDAATVPEEEFDPERKRREEEKALAALTTKTKSRLVE